MIKITGFKLIPRIKHCDIIPLTTEGESHEDFYLVKIGKNHVTEIDFHSERFLRVVTDGKPPVLVNIDFIATIFLEK